MKFYLLCLAGLAVTHSAMAQTDRFKTSFDCNAAKSAVDRTICGNEALAKLDLLMAAWYRVLRNKAAGPALLKNQRAWLRRRNRTCLSKRKGKRDSYEFRFCLQRHYERRIVAMARQARGGRDATVSGWYAYKKGVNFGGAFVAERPDGTIHVVIETVSGPTLTRATST